MRQKVPPQVLILAGIVGAGGVGIAAVVTLSVMGSAQNASKGGLASGSVLESPSLISEVMTEELGDEWLTQSRKLTIGSNAELMLENEAGVVRRYTIYSDGTALRRGGAYRVAAEPFNLAALPLERLPEMLSKARSVSGGEPREVVVGRDELGVLLWRVVCSGGSADVYFDGQGDWVGDPDGVR